MCGLQREPKKKGTYKKSINNVGSGFIVAMAYSCVTVGPPLWVSQGNIEKMDIEVVWERGVPFVGIGEDISISFQVHFGECGGYRLEFGGDNYFFPCSAIISGNHAQAILRPRALVTTNNGVSGRSRFRPITVLDLSHVTFQVKNRSGVVVFRVFLQWQLSWFTKDFYFNEGRRRANILFFGLAGCGKSTYLNSLLTILASREIHRAVVGGGNKHVTRKFVPYRIVKHGDKTALIVERRTRYFVSDTWGLDLKNYPLIANNTYEDILAGRLPKGFEMDQKNAELIQNAKKMEDQKIHLVIFFVHIGDVSGDLANCETAVVKRLRSFIQLATSKSE